MILKIIWWSRNGKPSKMGDGQASRPRLCIQERETVPAWPLPAPHLPNQPSPDQALQRVVTVTSDINEFICIQLYAA